MLQQPARRATVLFPDGGDIAAWCHDRGRCTQALGCPINRLGVAGVEKAGGLGGQEAGTLVVWMSGVKFQGM
eukprot:1149563-Pelagomonas_calceolata.AAC.1